MKNVQIIFKTYKLNIVFDYEIHDLWNGLKREILNSFQ